MDQTVTDERVFLTEAQTRLSIALDVLRPTLDVLDPPTRSLVAVAVMGVEKSLEQVNIQLEAVTPKTKSKGG